MIDICRAANKLSGELNMHHFHMVGDRQATDRSNLL